MINAVVFDIGNVLVRWRPVEVFDDLIGAARRTQLFAEVDMLEMNDRVDRGADLESELAALVAAHPSWSAEIAMWNDNWERMASPAIDESVTILRSLRTRGVPVYALSNFGTSTFERAERVYPFLAEFDARFISGYLGKVKPHADIYAHVEAHVPQAPHELIFVDDRPENVAAATARGWHGHVFDGASGLVERLSAAGLLTAA